MGPHLKLAVVDKVGEGAPARPPAAPRKALQVKLAIETLRADRSLLQHKRSPVLPQPRGHRVLQQTVIAALHTSTRHVEAP